MPRLATSPCLSGNSLMLLDLPVHHSRLQSLTSRLLQNLL
jgi:hypothetical protein